MIALGIFDGSLSYGCIGDARALSQQEMLNLQVSQLAAAQQATRPESYWQLLAQHRPFPDPSLDERFADFKTRLAAAIARRRK